ncbi:MAG: hypothetical protein ACK5HL_02505 [Bacilli bacterium]
MKSVIFNNIKWNDLIQYDLPKGIINSESCFFLFKNNSNELVKIYDYIYGEYVANKLLTLSCLIESSYELEKYNLILPKSIIVIDNVVNGYSMEYKKNVINLSTFLYNDSIYFKTKLHYLKEACSIIENVKNIKPYKQDFLLSDIHEDNFILDLSTNKIFAVDIDSCKIANNKPYTSKIPNTNKVLKNEKFNKYTKDSNNYIISNIHTENLCMNIMILNFISNYDINLLDKKEYNNYIDYLNFNGVNSKLCDSFYSIYKKGNTKSPFEHMNYLYDIKPEILEYNKILNKR